MGKKNIWLTSRAERLGSVTWAELHLLRCLLTTEAVLSLYFAFIVPWRHFTKNDPKSKQTQFKNGRLKQHWFSTHIFIFAPRTDFYSELAITTEPCDRDRSYYLLLCFLMARWQPLRLVFYQILLRPAQNRFTRPIKLQKTANDREVLLARRDAFFVLSTAHSTRQFLWNTCEKYIFINVYININIGHLPIRVKRALSSQSFALTPVPASSGSGSGRGLLRCLSRDHMACVCSVARMRACVRVSCPCDHQAGQRPARLGIVSSLLPSLPLSLLHSCYNLPT